MFSSLPGKSSQKAKPRETERGKKRDKYCLHICYSAAVQPLFGQLANIFGRRWLTMAIVALFTSGIGICGGASNGATLIAGRAIQGMGSGGINMIIDVIVSDFVPLRERGNFMALVLTVYFIGTSLGPFVGGAIVDNTSWRWVSRCFHLS